MTILQRLNQATFPMQTAGQPDSPAKTFQSVADNQGLMDSAVVCFLKLLDSSRAKVPKINPDGYSLKMLRTCFQSMEDGILRSFCINYPKLGMTANVSLLIQSHTFPKLESDYSLSDTLVDMVPAKYFLSDGQTQKPSLISSVALRVFICMIQACWSDFLSSTVRVVVVC